MPSLTLSDAHFPTSDKGGTSVTVSADRQYLFKLG